MSLFKRKQPELLKVSNDGVRQPPQAPPYKPVIETPKVDTITHDDIAKAIDELYNMMQVLAQNQVTLNTVLGELTQLMLTYANDQSKKRK